MQRADSSTLQALLPLTPPPPAYTTPQGPGSPSFAAFQTNPPQFLHPLHLGRREGAEMASAGAESPSQQPFLASPRGILTPRLSRMSSFGATSPSEILKAGLIHSRNELVLLFSRWAGSIHAARGPMPRSGSDVGRGGAQRGGLGALLAPCLLAASSHGLPLPRCGVP